MYSKCFLSFGKINKYLWLIILALIFYACQTIIENESKFFGGDNKLHPVIYCINYSLGLCLSFILIIIYKVWNKNKNKKNKTTVAYNNLNNLSQIKQVSRKEKYCLILLVSIIDFVAVGFSIIYYVDFDGYLNAWTSTIITMSLFSYCFLNKKLYKHHYLSIIFISVLGILINIWGQKFTIDNIEKNYIGYLISLFTETLFGLSYVIYKYMMLKKYIHFQEIMFFEGLIELIIFVLMIIFISKNGSTDNFLDYIHELDTKEIIIFISLMIIQFIYNSLSFMIINMFSPFHIFLLNILAEFVLYFFGIAEGKEDNIIYIILSIISFIICIFMILVYIEIIEINCFGLSRMTKKNIELRAELDSNINNNYYEDEKRIDYKDYSIDLIDDKFKELKEFLPPDDTSSFDEMKIKV